MNAAGGRGGRMGALYGLPRPDVERGLRRWRYRIPFPRIAPFLATALVLASLSFLVAGPARVAADAPFSPNVEVNRDGAAVWHVNPSLVVDARDNLYILWADNRSGDHGNYDIYASRSTDGGATWSADVKVNDQSHRNAPFRPATALAIDARGVLYAAWQDSRNG